MFQNVYPNPTVYTIGPPIRITNSFETGAEICDDLAEFTKSAQALLDDDSITLQVEEAFTLWCKSKFGDEFEFFNSDPKSSPFFAAFLAGWRAHESKGE